ncbi:MAG TPA: Fe-S protein assembly co-chaperone HscB [Polyangiaceae bacterium]
MSDPFELLGVPARYDLDLAELAQRQRELGRALHPDRYVGRGASERRQALGKAIEVNEAARLLKDPVKRAELLLARHGVAAGEGVERAAAPDFLMEIMELREALGELRRTRDVAGVEALCQRVEATRRGVIERLEHGFGQLSASGTDVAGDAKSHALGQQLLPLVAELRYYARFFAEAHAILDDFG